RAREQAPHLWTDDAVLGRVDERQGEHTLADVETDGLARGGAEVDHVVGHLKSSSEQIAEASQRRDDLPLRLREQRAGCACSREQGGGLPADDAEIGIAITGV